MRVDHGHAGLHRAVCQRGMADGDPGHVGDGIARAAFKAADAGGLVHHVWRSILGSSASRRPSPRMLTAS
ncbi:MAG TPA: hypothetical protein PLL92_17225, partial [Alicycliphilus sp.]|nr:hypothetical protein [Alicycliphilus sp.]